MEGFTIVDAVVAVVILVSAILAYGRGFVREVLAIAGWVIAAIVAYTFAPQAEPLVSQIPVLDKFLGDSCELSMVAAFAGVFALALIVMAIFTPLFSSAVRNSALSGLDQALGFLFGVARGMLLVAIAFVVYDRVLADATIPVVEKSRSAAAFSSVQDRLNEAVPEDAPRWVMERYQGLVGACGAPVQTEAGPTLITPPQSN
ncbi:membrane protein required for colicin V production [Albidovulum inexpectatum]|uniref:Membrane protein required for colicin V production n=1 Tax=Albidovulum inexpectatum TaxID=196587 RepID=A0A2S5JK16_9RHOB|nr:CvpA family protein [Albidovulum inexpectatum]PPB81783.1 membrane protein required for colicin V production [Albidovulum inexpectatum]